VLKYRGKGNYIAKERRSLLLFNIDIEIVCSAFIFIVDLALRFLGSPLLGVNVQAFRFGLVFFGIYVLCQIFCVDFAEGVFLKGKDRKDSFMFPLVLLAITGILGFGVQMQSMKNVTILYAIGLGVCAFLVNESIPWAIRGFTSSVIGYNLALYLHGNPEFYGDIFFK